METPLYMDGHIEMKDASKSQFYLLSIVVTTDFAEAQPNLTSTNQVT